MRKKKQSSERVIVGYDYSTREMREETADALFRRAKSARTAVEIEWEKCNDYYNGIHDATKEMVEYCRANDVPWIPANMPDPYILVETQINPNVPEPEFRGRDDDLDSAKAKQREFAVRYIIENNRLSDMNTRNERRLLKLGDAFWKAYWDRDMRCGVNEGDIRIRDIPTEAIFPDPAIRDGGLQDGQYVDYVYTMHKVKFCQVFRRELEELGLTADDILTEDYVSRAGVFDLTTAINDLDDTVQVLEHWFRQPCDTEEDGERVPAGAVACSILAGGRELRYIPNYWKRTCKQNRLFPFVHYWRIQDENRFWNKSELMPILELVDAADRKLAMSILNDTFLANDIILVEDSALADGEEFTNEPGAVIHLKQNRMGGVQRLGGLQSIANGAMGVEFFKSQIERASRNYDINQGRETTKVTTATGLAMMRQDAQSQADIKGADRDAGFERLYELLDWLALEFFDDDRMLFIGADELKDRAPQVMAFNADSFTAVMPKVLDGAGNVVREEWQYFPRVDVTITAGDSIAHGKAQTLQALQALTQSQITAENWKLFAAQLELIDLPGKQEIINEWQQRFAVPDMAESAGGGGTGALGEAAAGGAIPGAQTLPLLGGAPTA
nr:MAG TPA: Portal protein [Caudoviricetes sp.]